MSECVFCDELPTSCPPAGADSGALGSVFRAVSANPPTSTCFLSHAKLGLPSGNADPCRVASCSLLPTKEAVTRIKRLKKRFPYVARLDVPAGAGKHVATAGHIDFWAFAGFDFHSAVQAVEAI